MNYFIANEYCSRCFDNQISQMEQDAQNNHPEWFTPKRKTVRCRYDIAYSQWKHEQLDKIKEVPCFRYQPDEIYGISLCAKCLEELADEVRGV